MVWISIATWQLGSECEDGVDMLNDDGGYISSKLGLHGSSHLETRKAGYLSTCKIPTDQSNNQLEGLKTEVFPSFHRLKIQCNDPPLFLLASRLMLNRIHPAQGRRILSTR